LDEKRRNEIAFAFILQKMMKNQVPHLLVYAHQAGIQQEECSCFLREALPEMVKLGYKGKTDYSHFPDIPLSKNRRNEIAWFLIVADNFDRGIEIGRKIPRQVGNEAVMIEIPFAEAMIFARKVVDAVADKAFAINKS